MMEKNNCCVMCGDIIPEGKQCCSVCYANVMQDKTHKVSERKTTVCSLIANIIGRKEKKWHSV